MTDPTTTTGEPEGSRPLPWDVPRLTRLDTAGTASGVNSFTDGVIFT